MAKLAHPPLRGFSFTKGGWAGFFSFTFAKRSFYRENCTVRLNVDRDMRISRHVRETSLHAA